MYVEPVLIFEKMLRREDHIGSGGGEGFGDA